MKHSTRINHHWLHYLIILLSFVSGTAKSDPPQALRYAFNNNIPWTYKENGIFKGVEYEIIQATFKEMGYQLNAQELPSRRRYAYIATGKTDMTSVIYSQGFTDSSHDIYSDNLFIGTQPLYHNNLSAFAVKEKNIKISTQEDLHPYQVGHVLYHKDFELTILEGFPHVSNFGAPGSLAKALLQGRIDIAIDSNMALIYNAKQLGAAHRIEAVYKITELQVFPAWSRQNLKDELPIVVEQFNQALKRLKKRGEVASIIQKYGRLEHFSHYGNLPPP
jgi:polar amino acid transport system substrate-binding protein